MAKFTNVDYNKNLLFADSNPFADAFTEKYEAGKNAAINAYKQKVDSIAQEEMYKLRDSLKSPKYEQDLILNKGTDAEMLNPKFYDLMNFDDTDALKQARANAKKQGINPMSIKPGMILTDELQAMQGSAVRQHYEQLARYQDEYGEGALQKLLDKEGQKFQTFYRKFTDPYIAEGKGLWINTGPGAKQGNDQRALARKYPYLAEDIANGMRFKEGPDGVPYVVSGFGAHTNMVDYQTGMMGEDSDRWNPEVGGSPIKKDEEGRYYYDSSWDPISALASNIFGSGLIDTNRTYLTSQDEPDEWFWWAH